MNIQKLHENWTALGQEDPMWLVLTDPGKKGGRWQTEDFFETGRREIHAALEKIKQTGRVLKFERALDFGCGLGRLSQALAGVFSKVDAVDISASLLDQARTLNKFPDRVSYHLNVRTDLSIFPPDTFDFIYSNICLQHIPAQFQKLYVAEFVRRLRPGGSAYFQVIHARGWRHWVPGDLADAYRKIKNRGRPFISMHPLPAGQVCTVVHAAGGAVCAKEFTPYAGYETRFVNGRFLVTK